MDETKREILNIITNYCIENSNQRIGQILFNLSVNEFEINSEETRDIYNDSDDQILQRIKARINQFKNEKNVNS